jgi:hypothetical protein
MDVITVGSPIAVDRASTSGRSTNSSSSALTFTSPESQIELPSEERLLPVGGPVPPRHQPPGPSARRGEGILDRVWQVFGQVDESGAPLIEEKMSGEKIQVVASVHKQVRRKRTRRIASSICISIKTFQTRSK